MRNGYLNINRIAPRPPRRLTFGAEVRIEDLQAPKLETVPAEVEDEDIRNNIDLPTGKKRRRPRKVKTDE